MSNGGPIFKPYGCSLKKMINLYPGEALSIGLKLHAHNFHDRNLQNSVIVCVIIL